LSPQELEAVAYSWRVWARAKQLPPEGDWSTWVVRAGRVFGKTALGSGWINERALAYPKRRIALCARTPAEARDVMIEGPSGILQNSHPAQRPLYEPSKRRLTWSNGSWATIYSDEEPDQLRGFSGDTGWLDEFAKFKNPEDVWDNLQFGLRELSNDRPRCLITTTPRPLDILKRIEAMDSTRRVVGSSYENKACVDPKFFEDIASRYEGTRLGRQELNAEILDDVPGALWTRSILDKIRHRGPTPDFKRVVIGVDPSGTGGDDQGNRVGIVAVGLGVDGCGYVLADYTCSLSPDGWGRRVIECSDRFNADRIVAERNFGGAMVEHVIRTVRKTASIKMVTASRGKSARAEPVAALYEQTGPDGKPGRVRHVGNVPDLEDQQINFTSEGYVGGGSPDRVDALVWSVSDLMLARQWDIMSKVFLPVYGR
jgi:phage terminase large subunit-like protein